MAQNSYMPFSQKQDLVGQVLDIKTDRRNQAAFDMAVEDRNAAREIGSQIEGSPTQEQTRDLITFGGDTGIKIVEAYNSASKEQRLQMEDAYDRVGNLSWYIENKVPEADRQRVWEEAYNSLPAGAREAFGPQYSPERAHRNTAMSAEALDLLQNQDKYAAQLDLYKKKNEMELDTYQKKADMQLNAYGKRTAMDIEAAEKKSKYKGETGKAGVKDRSMEGYKVFENVFSEDELIDYDNPDQIKNAFAEEYDKNISDGMSMRAAAEKAKRTVVGGGQEEDFTELYNQADAIIGE